MKKNKTRQHRQTKEETQTKHKKENTEEKAEDRVSTFMDPSSAPMALQAILQNGFLDCCHWSCIASRFHASPALNEMTRPVLEHWDQIDVRDQVELWNHIWDEEEALQRALDIWEEVGSG